MKAHKALLLLATGLCTANRSLAQTANYSPDKERTAVYFVNGMFTDEADAKNNLSSLRWLAEVALQNTVGADGSVIFQNAYNQNEPAWEQLVQVYAQKAGDDLSMFWRMMAGNASLPDWLRQAIGDASTSSADQPFANDADLQEHLQRYRQVLDLHEKLIIVGHSQGNLYANAAYAALAAEKAEYAAATGVVGVATLASTVAGAVDGAPYTTFNEDWVIQAVRFLYPSTLPPTATTGTTSVDGLGHGFQTAYMVVPDSRNQILSNMLTVEARLVPVPKPATGLDPTCFPLITDPTDCADALARRVHLIDRLRFVENGRAICCRLSTATHEPLPPISPVRVCRMGQSPPTSRDRVTTSRESSTS